MRTFAAVLGLLAAVAPAAAQSSVYSTAVPPSAAELRPLNLTTAWTTAVPVDGRRDGIARVQVVDGGQIFVQTKRGVLVALDAGTGGMKWAFQYTTQHAPTFAIAVNDRFVFAVNVVTLYCIHRATGVTEFAFPLPQTPSTGPAADNESVYVVLGSGRLAAYGLPNPVTMPVSGVVPRGGFGDVTRDVERQNPANTVADRYPTGGRAGYFPEESFDAAKVKVGGLEPAGATLQRTASLAVVPTLMPPFRLFDDNGKYISKTESLGVVSSLRQPYRLNDPTSRYAQRTPSVSVMPPSVAAVYEMTNKTVRGIEPLGKWVYGAPSRLAAPPILTRSRVWLTTASPTVLSVLKLDKVPQIDAQMPDAAAAPPGQAEDVGYFPLQDGNLLAVDLTAGGGPTLRAVWRANVGGLMNKTPVPTANAVFMAGDNSGITRLDRKTGDVTWKTESTHDTLLAVNDEFAYIRDRVGRVHVYDRDRASDPRTLRAYPLAGVDLPGFNAAVTNEKTDRVILAADNGLVVCLRDASAKYAVPVTMAPPAVKPLPPPLKAADPATGISPTK